MALQITWTRVRDVVLFFGGLAGVGYETLGQRVDRPDLLVLFAGMMGLPAVFAGDVRLRGPGSPPPPPTRAKATKAAAKTVKRQPRREES